MAIGVTPPPELLILKQGLLNQVNDAIVTVDREYSIRYWNRAAETLFCREGHEALGRHYKDACGTLWSDDECTEIRAEIFEQGHWKGEIQCIDSRGNALVLDVSFSVLKDIDGAVQGFVGIHRNVTRNRRMEEQLRATESRLKLAQSALGLGTWEIDLKTGESTWSKELFGVFGLPGSASDPTLAQWAEKVHPDDRETMVREALNVSNRFENTDHQYRIVWPDNSVHWLHTKATVVCDSNMQPCKLIGVDFDITAVKEAERSNGEFATIVECTDLAIFTSDMAGDIVTWNSGAEKIFGYSTAEATGEPICLLVPDEHRQSFAEISERIGRGQKTEHLETVCLTKSGKPIQILLSAAPILDQSGITAGGAYILWDVNEIKLLQRQLVQAQKLESIGQLAAGIAHEINTPIQYIGDNAQFLEEGFRDLFRLVEPSRNLADALRTEGKSDAVTAWDNTLGQIDLNYLHREIPLAIEQLLQGVRHVARIVRAMKEFSHPGSVEMSMVDINRAIESTALVSKNEWKYVAELTTDLDPNLPLTPCLGGEFNQVILNLIVNAAHAIGDVVGNTETKGYIKISTHRRDQQIEIRVSDSGTGIPESIQSKVFDPFFTTKDVGMGTGQGLAMAYSVIVQKHRGTIRFETKQGEGTTFVIQLPLGPSTREA